MIKREDLEYAWEVLDEYGNAAQDQPIGDYWKMLGQLSQYYEEEMSEEFRELFNNEVIKQAKIAERDFKIIEEEVTQRIQKN